VDPHNSMTGVGVGLTGALKGSNFSVEVLDQEVSQFRDAVWGSGMMFVELRRTRILTEGNSQFVLNLKSDT
jgi:hypothetical protein